MGNKKKGGGSSGRGGSGSSYSPALNSKVTGGRKENRKEPTEAARNVYKPATKKGPAKLKPLGKADAKLVGAAKSARKPTKAQRELQLAASVRSTIARNHRKLGRSK